MPLLDPKHRLYAPLTSPCPSLRKLTPIIRSEFPGLKGVYGAVTVEGEALEVYRVKTVGNRTVGYVEAKDGKEFQVVMRDERTAVKDSYRLGIFVDGMECVSSFEPSPSVRRVLILLHRVDGRLVRQLADDLLVR